MTITVDAAPVRTHVHRLRRSGMSHEQIAAVAGLSGRAMREIATDRERVLASTADRILAVRPQPGEPRPDREWAADAACADKPQAIFYMSTEKELVLDLYAEARSICRSCPVWESCLDEAIRLQDRWGMWGGHTPRERHAIARGLAPWPHRVPDDPRPGDRARALRAIQLRRLREEAS